MLANCVRAVSSLCPHIRICSTYVVYFGRLAVDITTGEDHEGEQAGWRTDGRTRGWACSVIFDWMGGGWAGGLADK